MRGAALSFTLPLAAGVMAALFAANPVSATPQMLVLLESDGALPLQCQGARCVAELATMCLQPKRRMPEAGRPYRAMDVAAITVTGLDQQGQRVQRPLPDAARVTALRGHVAVRLEISATWLRRNFAAVQGVAVTAGAVLAPLPVAGDTWPMTRAEVVLAKDRAGSVARDAFAANPGFVLTARVSNYLINALPAGAAVQREALETARQHARGETPASAGQLATTRFQVDYCQHSAKNGLAASLRSCLQGRQDRALEHLHQNYIDALGTGS
ncbi:MAG: hypothetical protein O2967_19660 [Proteobacteria bacterium]|nr:hypothetical protein [Pseudomonadota bacterium]